MPIKEAKKKVPKKKRGQKQKQKQIVKQNVKVTVQSSGGSGAGGTSVPASAPVYQMPQSFYPDQSLIRNLVQQAVKQQVKAPEYNPSNDETNFKAVFQGKSDLNKPLVAGVGVIEPEMQAKEKKKGRGPNKPKIIAYPVESGTESDYQQVHQFQEPVGFPAQNRYMAELEAKQKEFSRNHSIY